MRHNNVVLYELRFLALPAI